MTVRTRFRCPCRTCPNCGARQYGEHPEDGLAYCHDCAHPTSVIEWWVSAGPHRDGRHPKTNEELLAWQEHDSAVLRGEI